MAGSVIGSVLELTDSVCDAFNLTPRDTSREERKADDELSDFLLQNSQGRVSLVPACVVQDCPAVMNIVSKPPSPRTAVEQQIIDSAEH